MTVRDSELRADLAHAITKASIEAELAGPVDETTADKWINGVMEFLGVLVLATITLLVFANAFLRYTLNSGIIWADEVVIALVPWLAMLGMFLSVRRREIIRIGFLIDQLKPRSRRLLLVCTELFSTVAFGYLALVSFNYLSLFGADRSVYLSVSKGWFTSAMCIGAGLICLAFLAEAIGHFRRNDAVDPGETGANAGGLS
ncbi:TRAP transporter small permease [Aminobacter aganoensis]|uniref:TRAP transporter small permease protein n=1 Tax=Aminobacter aganoensis TaxID=83264 RepID=A0A7X0F6V9_9HYPH|nr:TRAP transporter small permease [Aminobacter aganoensis]MBB6354038.1 TRAP-type C4-dicarboxylate transport system permease small subunit [Aminobacter aganoensis]